MGQRRKPSPDDGGAWPGPRSGERQGGGWEPAGQSPSAATTEACAGVWGQVRNPRGWGLDLTLDILIGRKQQLGIREVLLIVVLVFFLSAEWGPTFNDNGGR